jgi:hypothetical protein
MTPTEEEVDELLEEIKVKVALADKIAAANPDGSQPCLPLSPNAARTALALAGLPDDGRVPQVRGTYRGP